MGLKGPLRDPDSVRGQREGAGNINAPTIESQVPVPPAWLAVKEKRLFEQLIDDAQRAGIPVLAIDSHAYAMVSRLMLQAQKEKDGNTLARIMRSLLPWMQAAGLNALGRARLGVKREKKKTGTVASILEAKHNRGA